MNHNVGDIIKGTISGIKQYGVFVKFENTFGFCHISNCSHKFIKNLNDLFTINQEVVAKIIEIDNEINRINVSIKDCENVEMKPKVNKPKEVKSPIQIETKKSEKSTFEDMLKDYLKKSDERLVSIGRRNQKHRKR